MFTTNSPVARMFARVSLRSPEALAPVLAYPTIGGVSEKALKKL